MTIFGKKKNMNLIELLSQIDDPRRKVGMRYQLVPVLLIIIMGIMSGYNGYREISRYAEANKKVFLKFFSKKRKQLPSHVTFREILKSIDFQEVLSAFEKWALKYVSIEKQEWFSIDGKALGSTVSNYSTEYQNFVSLVSIFSHKRGQVISVGKLENKKDSEIPTVESLIEKLGLKDVVFTLDALHCQKKL
jgi:hypothetical protein